MKWTGEWCTRGVCLSQLWVLIRLTVCDRAAESVCLCVCACICVFVSSSIKRPVYMAVSQAKWLWRGTCFLQLSERVGSQQNILDSYNYELGKFRGFSETAVCALNWVCVCVAHPVINRMKHEYEGIKVCLCVPGLPLCLPTPTCVSCEACFRASQSNMIRCH